MAAPAKIRRQRDPNDPVQVIHRKKGDIRVAGKAWIVGPGVGKMVIPIEGGGYRFLDGPITSDEYLMQLPEPDRTKALKWWAERDSWQNEAPRKIAFETGTGYPIYEDTGEYVESDDELMAYWPAGPVLFAAVRALGDRKKAQVEQKEPRVTYESATRGIPEPEPEPPVLEKPVEKEPEKMAAPARPRPLLNRAGRKLSKEHKAKIKAGHAAKKVAKAATPNDSHGEILP